MLSTVLYLVTTVLASILGILSTLAIKGQYAEGDFGEPEPPMISLGCNMPGYMVVEQADGNLACSANYTEMSSTFVITDVSGSFVTASKGAADDISLSDTVYQGVFLKLVTDNIIESFA